ncbi:TAP-like protein-domain-containing protein [Mycena leptocephala]|nr:TAP-like protein-domain-containing protein [Mycena leptocephala]
MHYVEKCEDPAKKTTLTSRPRLIVLVAFFWVFWHGSSFSMRSAPYNFILLSKTSMRMFPATVPTSERLGSIFTNPGGPGGSGHSGLLRTGPLLRVNLTTPRISCHPTNLHRELYSLAHDSGDLDFNGADIATLNKSLLVTSSRAELLTGLCRDAVGDNVLRSVTTVNVARDLEEMRKAVGDGGLHYWGFSYGTTLGATYVAMFPEHSERVVLDGVVYAPEQYTSLVDHGLSAGTSTNGVFEGFISNCVSAGPERCALMTSADTTAAQLSARIWGLASRLQTIPMPVLHPTKGGVPSILHRGHLLGAIFSAMYRPKSWTELAEAIAQAENGDGTALAELSGRHTRNITDAQRGEEAGWGPGHEMGPSEAGTAVSCGDAPPFEVGLGDEEVWTKQWMEWRNRVWFSGVVRCRHWGRVQPSPPRYEGSWELGNDCGKPVIFVSNSFDPITPISSGRRMVELFGKENARLLHNNGYGHCSTNHPSVCIAKVLKEYMINGTLFAEGTVCEPDEGILFPPKEDAGQMSFVGYSNEDKKLARTLRLLADTDIGMPPVLEW